MSKLKLPAIYFSNITYWYGEEDYWLFAVGAYRHSKSFLYKGATIQLVLFNRLLQITIVNDCAEYRRKFPNE